PAQLAHAFRQTRPARDGPESASRQQDHLPALRFLAEFLHLALAGASEEKELVKVPLSHEVRLSGRQSGVLAEFALRKRTQRNYRSAEIGGQLGKSFCRSRLRLRNRNARVPAEADRTAHFQVKIVFREIDSAAILADVGIALPESPAWFIKLRPCARLDPHARQRGGGGLLKEAVKPIPPPPRRKKKGVCSHVPCLCPLYLLQPL